MHIAYVGAGRIGHILHGRPILVKVLLVDVGGGGEGLYHGVLEDVGNMVEEALLSVQNIVSELLFDKLEGGGGVFLEGGSGVFL